MAEADLETLRGFELRLLRCSLSPVSVQNDTSPCPPPPTPANEQKGDSLLLLIEDIINLIENGDYVRALSSDAVRLIFGFADLWEFEDTIDCADRFYCEMEKSVESFLGSLPDARISVPAHEDDVDLSCRALLVMCIGVAALLAFTQCNVTGFEPSLLLQTGFVDGIRLLGFDFDLLIFSDHLRGSLLVRCLSAMELSGKCGFVNSSCLLVLICLENFHLYRYVKYLCFFFMLFLLLGRDEMFIFCNI